ncbi:hypothetical protein Acr_29g0004630 [Actinidia rufa]|uniref:Uncharacterized protein n=1 Tax=Actinidia rufa TaxID=165716 RepID=A0A7J0HEA8_9ERIC|nr:hypothetical protein Acr_29g0004630 [Actinidia rufa]
MVHTKNPTLCNVDEGGSQPPKKSKRKRPMSETGGPKAKKRKYEARKEIARWKKSLEGQKVTCERMVSTMEGADAETKEVVKILKNVGLSFFFKLLRSPRSKRRTTICYDTRVEFYVTELEKLGDAKYKTESESEEEEDEGSKEQRGGEQGTEEEDESEEE